MAVQLDYGTDPGTPMTQDWPTFLEAGSKVDGVIEAFNDYRPTRSYISSKSGLQFICAEVQFVVLDNGFMDGYHIKGSIQIPADGEKVLVDSAKSMDRLRRDWYPLGIDLAKFPTPVNEDELIQMFNGEGPWAENGPLFGKTLIQVTCGEPNTYINKKTLKEMGPFTTIRRFSSPAPETVELLKERLEKYHLDKAEAEKKANAAPNGGMADDDYPF